jgi:hypothetical protein
VLRYIPIKLLFIICLLSYSDIYAQDEKGSFTGGFQSSANVFIRDSLIGAANIPQYDSGLFGVQSWLDLGYNQNGFDLSVRFDMFNNSNLLNPNESYTDEGIGRWHIEKRMDKFSIKVGHIYDQIGSGIIYRAYEERPLLIDNALYGGRLIYRLSDNWEAKVFAGRQRFLFSEYDPTIRGANIEGFLELGDPEKGKIISLAPGFGMINRTLNQEAVNQIGSAIRNYVDEQRFELKRNTFAYSLYNTVTYGPVSLYTEAAYKSSESFFNPFKQLILSNGNTTDGRWVREAGTVFYSSLSYAGNGLGVTVEAKRTENFEFRADPQLLLLRGLITYIPPMNRNNTYRLTARYSPATQLLSEQAYQIDAVYRWSKSLTTSANYSSIESLEGERFFREVYTEIQYKYKRKWQVKGGVQHVNYNQELYEVKPGVPNVRTLTPYIDFLYKLTRKQSLRFESQVMFVGQDEKAGFRQDYGNWIFALLEYNIAPHWSFVVSDMYNSSAGKNTPVNAEGEKQLLHYPRLDVYYTQKTNRFSLSYIKQVEGIVCSGGVCRLEPAFSGFNFTVNSTF